MRAAAFKTVSFDELKLGEYDLLMFSVADAESSSIE